MQPVCSISHSTIRFRSEIIFQAEQELFSEFSKSVYRHFDFDYPKFYKMDNLSKLAFIGAELLLPEYLGTSEEKNIALVFGNKSSSLDTDLKHQSSISDDHYFPSPAVFVYTLPNICLGEISIRHGLRSENCFFVLEEMNESFLLEYAQILLNTGKADGVLCGWVEYLLGEYEAHFWLLKGHT